MKKKNLNVHNELQKILDDNEINKIYLNFKKKLKLIGKKSFLVAVSGGPDSLALTALSKLYINENKSKAYFVIIDHNIRKNSSIEANQVKKILKKKNIVLQILKNKNKITKNIQSQARESRYALLLSFCKKNDIKYILTAHHSDDQIETFLIRLSRGSGIQGLSSMDDVAILDKKTKLLRPLLKEKKKELIKITRKVFEKSIKDPSNKNKKYLRTRVRLLKKELEKSGIFHDQIIKSIDNLTSTRDTLNLYI
ncbi:tRNA lysidine(34) synthetase TilS, partial [Pelagibacteraceae bacterium]|nr:tRNA lysidine(34) synthetase TilS [Pelagibacteraceae bacterium]